MLCVNVERRCEKTTLGDCTEQLRESSFFIPQISDRKFLGVWGIFNCALFYVASFGLPQPLVVYMRLQRFLACQICPRY